MMRFDHDGQERERVPVPVLSYGYMWNGSVDERSRLWAQRAHPEGEGPVYDVFDREGNHVSTVRISPAAAQTFVPRIREGHLYTLRLDELDVHKVVRVPLPEPLRDEAPIT